MPCARNVDAVQAVCASSSKTRMNSCADDLALLSRDRRRPPACRGSGRRRRHRSGWRPSRSRKTSTTCSGLALAKQAVVDVNARQLLADRADQERRDDGRIHAARQRQQHFFIADLRAKLASTRSAMKFSMFQLASAWHSSKTNARSAAVRASSSAGQARAAVVVGAANGNAEFTDLGRHVDRDAVDDAIHAAVQNNAAHVGQALQKVRRHVVGIDFAVNAERADLARQTRVFVAAKIENDDAVRASWFASV